MKMIIVTKIVTLKLTLKSNNNSDDDSRFGVY